VRSLVAQTYPSWQAIVASDDGVDYLAVLERAGICDDRLQQMSTGACRSGQGNARDVALASARGAILCNLDADDEFRADRLELLAPLALAHGAAVDNTGVHRPSGGLHKRPFPDARAITPPTADAYHGLVNRYRLEPELHPRTAPAQLRRPLNSRSGTPSWG
jgi:succinoglycan biosynthesis protein ExoO